MGTERALYRFTRQLPDLVWNTTALEGNTFTLPEERTLLDGVTVGGKDLAEQQQILDLSAAFNTVYELVEAEDFDVSADTSNRVHAVVAWHEALDVRLFRGDGSVTSDGGGVHLMNGRFVEFDPATELHAAHAELLDSLALLDAPIERGLAYFCFATHSQFYFDGSKRTARLMKRPGFSSYLS
ncbi:hypothetical protein MHK03_12465 [Corynebacterium simulans]|uniref:hypothetical protein n=1 Tax=Corynebacterium simulans TaxID=146827 RepID=UPI001EF2A69A|nr:hypothetical protein [Corynebacterium simulans]MCG7248710.1 hypothetical protein [Corynebacterium simulans]